MRANEFIVEYRKNAMVGGIDLSFEYDDKFGESARVQAFSNGRKLGYAEFLVVKDNELEATDLEVDERYRGQGIARLMYDFVKQQGYKIHRSHAQTMDGHAFWDKNRGDDAQVWEQELSEISRDRLERYLSRATRQVDSRQERMARARQRLNTSYEIYHAEHPTKIVDRFEADTPADAQRYYQDYIERYQSDVDYDLRLRRGTGIMEGLPPMGFNKNPNKHDPIKNPLRTFVEIANMLGITHKQLVGLQRNYLGFPDPFPGIGKQIGRGRNNYYALNQVKQWINNNNIDEKIKAWNDNTPAIDENFADGKVKGNSRPGRVKRAGASCNGSVTDLRRKAKNASGERAKMYHWCANMKSGRKKNK